MVKEHQISQRQACKAVSLPQSTVRYKPVPNNDDEVINALHLLIEKHPSIGFWQTITGLEEWDMSGITNGCTGFTRS